MKHEFLILCVLLALPPALIAFMRRDLRRPMAFMGVIALPFAFSERWFYPEYWRPHFLFDLGDRWGFGVEDFLFVAELAACTCALYPCLMRRRFVASDTGATARGTAARLAGALVALFGTVLVLRLCQVPTIFGACLAMLGVTLGIVVSRTDLARPSAVGGALCLLTYTALCLLLMRLIPGVFELSWNTRLLTNRFVLGVPVEELLYAFSAGLVGTCAYPFLTNRRFAPLAPCLSGNG